MIQLVHCGSTDGQVATEIYQTVNPLLSQATVVPGLVCSSRAVNCECSSVNVITAHYTILFILLTLTMGGIPLPSLFALSISSLPSLLEVGPSPSLIPRRSRPPTAARGLGPDLQNILRRSYDNAKVTINLRRTSNLQNSLQ